MKIVLDTNIILASISTYSPYRIVIDKLLDAKFELIISNEVLLEYEEKIAEKFSPAAAANFIDALLMLPNVTRIDPLFFSWILLDRDDNKFLDLYYTGRANYLVTNDSDFDIIKQITRPEHHVIKIKEFIELIK